MNFNYYQKKLFIKLKHENYNQDKTGDGIRTTLLPIFNRSMWFFGSCLK